MCLETLALDASIKSFGYTNYISKLFLPHILLIIFTLGVMFQTCMTISIKCHRKYFTSNHLGTKHIYIILQMSDFYKINR